MQNSEIGAVTLGTIVLAGSFLSELGPQSDGWIPFLGGIVLLVILFSYDRASVRTGWQSLAFGSVAGFCAALALTRFVVPWLLTVIGAVIGPRPILWLVATLIFFFVDRSRMGARQLTGASPSTPPVNLSWRTPEVPTPVAPPPQAHPVNHWESPEAVDQPVRLASPVVPPPESVVVPEPTYTPANLSFLAEQPVPVAAPPLIPQAVPLSTGSGKPVTVYLNLLNQGIACLRTVQAEHLGRDFYRIVEPEPEGENWQFHPGQIVRCRKQKLSNGKGLVAFEEAPRATT